MATLRNLKIKTSTCKRIVKELHSYEKEVETEAAKTAKMKENGADPYDLKQQVSFPVSISFRYFDKKIEKVDLFLLLIFCLTGCFANRKMCWQNQG